MSLLGKEVLQKELLDQPGFRQLGDFEGQPDMLYVYATHMTFYIQYINCKQLCKNLYLIWYVVIMFH